MNIIVRSIPQSTTSYDLIEYFKVFGHVEKAHVSGDCGYIQMHNRDDGLKILNTVKNPSMKGKRIYLEPENSSIGMSREGLRENFQNPYGNWMEQPRDTMGYDYGMPPERNSHSEFDPWKQGNQDFGQNGSRTDESVPESFVYVDPHGYSRDPTMRPAPEYYYRIKLLDNKSKFP